MRRRIVFGLCLMMLCFFTVTGCQKGGNSDLGKNTAGSSGESEFPTSQADAKFLPNYECSGTYYKLEITPTVYDAVSWRILSSLRGMDGSNFENRVMNTVTG